VKRSCAGMVHHGIYR